MFCIASLNFGTLTTARISDRCNRYNHDHRPIAPIVVEEEDEERRKANRFFVVFATVCARGNRSIQRKLTL